MSPSEAIGAVLLAMGGAIALQNVYLTWIRVPLLRALRRPHHWVSGVPLLGFLLLSPAAVLLRQRPWIVAVAFALLLADTCGPHWFIVALALDRRRRPRKER